MKVLRTPDERFANLPDYPFEPHHAEIPDLEGGTLRMHYVDEGPRDAAPVVFIHGNPSWSYLWRKMIPPEGGSHFLQEDIPDAWLAHFMPWLEAAR